MMDIGNVSGQESRRNLAESFSEYWRPPVLLSGVNRIQRLMSAMRRFFDLQAGTIWRDFSKELPAASGTVLDVGCGAQPYRRLLPAHVHYIAIDTADASKHFGYEAPGTRYFTGDRWPVEDESVDLILCSEVLEHVSDPGIFLSEMYRCLRPGARVLLTVPFAARWHFIPFDYWRYTPAGLKQLLTKANFEQVIVYARGNPLTVACYKMMALLLPLLFPQNVSLSRVIASRIFGFLALPVIILLAGISNLSSGIDWGNDCLGYTVSARRFSAECHRIKDADIRGASENATAKCAKDDI
jgi:SAM-dependent methyltransferase